MTVNKIEKRVFPVEMRKSADSKTVSGHAALFDSFSVDFGGWKEIIQRGAFTESVMDKEADVRALFNHSDNHLLGRYRGTPLKDKRNTLSLKETDNGLHYDLDMPEHRSDLIELIERGDLTQNSFQFTVKDAHWEKRDGMDVRVITKIDKLYDISLVTFPAYPDTDVALRSFKEMKQKETPKPTDYSMFENIITLHKHTF